MKRLFTLLVLLAPIGVMAYLRLQPEADAEYNNPLFHFYIVTFTTFAAAVISLLLTASLGDSVQPRHLLAATAFGVMGTVFFSHGVATPNALLNYTHPAVMWSAWITLLSSGLIFSLAGMMPTFGGNSWVPIHKLLVIITALVVIYLGIAIFAHQILDQIGAQAAPWHRRIIFGFTLLFWGFATVRLGWIWTKTKGRVDGAMVFVSTWLFFATISMHNFETWRLSWWLYHFLMLICFLVVAVVLVREYEQTRRFQLTRYYLAASLILTALLALFVSYIFADYSFNTLVNRTRNEASTTTAALTSTILQSLDPNATNTSLLIEYARSLEGQPIGDQIILFRDTGFYFYPFDEYDEPKLIPDSEQAHFDEAMRGNIFVEIIPPGEGQGEYATSNEAHSLFVFAPLYRPGETKPIGVLQTIRAVPELTNAILSARVTGLLLAAATMGLLFFALLLVIRRADFILTQRSQELEKAYTDLKRAEMLRDDMTNMIVHDLRNPITAISTSLEFIEKTSLPPSEGPAQRFTNIAKNAAQKMIRLVDDILTVSKFEAGELKLHRENVLVTPLIAKTLDGFRSQSEAEQKQLRSFCPEDLRVYLDPSLITRVLDNLIANAFKYTEDQKGSIEVFVQRGEARVYFHVRDNGEGIPDAYKTQIFDKFKQVPQNGSERKGTGLGLTFCRMVVETHGGEISVQDAEGGGSEFIFWLPHSDIPFKN